MAQPGPSWPDERYRPQPRKRRAHTRRDSFARYCDRLPPDRRPMECEDFDLWDTSMRPPPPLPERRGDTVVITDLPISAHSQATRTAFSVANDLDQMIGQMLMVGFAGQDPGAPWPRRIAQQIADGRIGGVILMGRNIRSPRQLRALTNALLSTRAALPPLLAVDQEGGLVQRLSQRKGFPGYPSAAWLAANRTPQKAYQIYRQMARTLARYGLNLNLGPVVDVNTNPDNPVIGRLRRSYGADPDTVEAFARAFIRAHHRENVLTALKHFPGHGSSTRDSHLHLVNLSGRWSQAELLPYQALIRDGLADMVMTGHLYHPHFSDGPRVPASLSERAIKGLLRHALGFRGVVITDDLEMGAIRESGSFAQSLIRAVNAGNDILLISNTARSDPGLPERALAILRRAVRGGQIDEQSIRDSYRRITALKARLRRHHEARAGSPETRSADSRAGTW